MERRLREAPSNESIYETIKTMALFSWSYKRRSWRERFQSISFWLIVAVCVTVSVVTWTWPLLAIIGVGVLLERIGILPRVDKFFSHLFSSFRGLFSKPSTKAAPDDVTEILSEEEETLNLAQSSHESDVVIEGNPTELELLSEEFTMLPESIKTTLLELYATEECQAWLKMQDKASTLSVRYSRFYKPDHSKRGRLENKANNALCTLLSPDEKELAHAEGNMQDLSRHLWEKHPEIRHLDFSSVSFQGKGEVIQRFQPLLRQLLLSNPSITHVTFHPKDSDLADTCTLVDTLMEPHKIAQAVYYCVQQKHSTVCTQSLWQQVRGFVDGVIQRVLNSRASFSKHAIPSSSSENLHAMLPPETWTQEVDVAQIPSDELSTSWGLLAASHSIIGSDEAEENEREVEESAVKVVQGQKEDNVEQEQTLLQIADIPLVPTQEEPIVKPTISEVLAAKKALAEKIINRYVQWNLDLTVNKRAEALQKEAPTSRFPIFSHLMSKTSNKKSNERVQEEAKKAAELAAREIIQLSMETEPSGTLETSLASQLRKKIRTFSPEVLANKQADSEMLTIYSDAYHILNNISVESGTHRVIPTKLKTRADLNWLEEWDANHDVRLHALSESNVKQRERQTKIAEGQAKIEEGQAKIEEGQAKIAEGQAEIDNKIGAFREDMEDWGIRQQAELEEVRALFMQAKGWTRAELDTEMAKISGRAFRTNRPGLGIFGFGYSPLSLVFSEKPPQEKLTKDEIASVLLKGYSEFSCQTLLWDTLALLKNKDTSLVSLSLCAYQFAENRVKLHRQKKAQSMEKLNAHLGSLMPYFQSQSVIGEVALQQREAMWMDEKYFLLYLLVSPSITALNFEHIKIPEESLNAFNAFLENVIMFNPHITHITLHRDNEASFPEKLQTKLEENRQWQAANHYAKMTASDYQHLNMPISQKELKAHLHLMVKAYLEATKFSIMTWLKRMKPNSPQLKEWESLHEQVTHFFKRLHDIQDNKKHYFKTQQGVSDYAQQLVADCQQKTVQQEVGVLYGSLRHI